ncbi:hypothetical protein SLS60_010735 [Paraconiothyrium brasiliense]|uniref:C2H2-type domain-containing protein n=1 Tax=Paraconiothyrium brasiliense TaxID=300254 RepID=A0ABR3QM20_9PLEO
MDESAFDINLDFSFCNPSPAVDIAKWREDISGPALLGQDLFSMIDFKDFKGVDATSEYSMDSAYQSQSGSSRRGGAYQSSPIQNQPSHSFMNQGISPSLASETFVPFPESHDINQVSNAGNLDFGNGSQWFANSSSAQDFTTYSPSMAQTMQPSAFAWDSTEVSNYDYTSYNLHHETEFFRSQPSPQREVSRPRVETSARPSYFASERTFSHASAHSSNGRASVVSPVQPIQSQSFADASYDSQQLAGLGFETAQTNSPSEEFVMEDTEELKTLEEEHHKVARSHPLYSKEPGADGLYHCPSEGESGCNHKPTTLKCNYDKYVDSHLKPFRCKIAKCEAIPFSSTACLLRHEREAHGMHGHGARPNLCHYADCERSSPGQGFPRRYNLFDHMRRVHGWQGDKDVASATLDGQPGARKARMQKRKATASPASALKVEKKARISKVAQQQQLRERQRTRLNAEWATKKQSIASLLAELHDLGDMSEAQDAQLRQEISAFFELREKYHTGIKDEFVD